MKQVSITSSMLSKTEDIEAIVNGIKRWISCEFQSNGGKAAVIGISGGADSTVAAKLLVDALGPDNVIGVFMPNGVQADIDDAIEAAKAAGVTRTLTVNIADAYKSLSGQISEVFPEFKAGTPGAVNLSPRLRMAILYAIAPTVGSGRVCCTGNLSESTVGYCTIFGDLAGDFAPFARLSKQAVCIIGKHIGLPERLVDKPPSDGLTGKTDEDNFGFTYGDIEEFIKLKFDDISADTLPRIWERYWGSEFKRKIVHIPSFPDNAADSAGETKFESGYEATFGMAAFDITKVSTEGVVIAHCIASDLMWGSGVAPVIIRDMYNAEKQCRSKCSTNPDGVAELPPVGGILPVKTERGTFVNLITKEHSWDKPTYKTFTRSLKALRDWMESTPGIPHRLVMPRIGCGRDNLEWAVVENIIKGVFFGSRISVFICLK